MLAARRMRLAARRSAHVVAKAVVAVAFPAAALYLAVAAGDAAVIAVPAVVVLAGYALRWWALAGLMLWVLAAAAALYPVVVESLEGGSSVTAAIWFGAVLVLVLAVAVAAAVGAALVVAGIAIRSAVSRRHAQRLPPEPLRSSHT